MKLHLHFMTETKESYLKLIVMMSVSSSKYTKHIQFQDNQAILLSLSKQQHIREN